MIFHDFTLYTPTRTQTQSHLHRCTAGFPHADSHDKQIMCGHIAGACKVHPFSSRSFPSVYMCLWYTSKACRNTPDIQGNSVKLALIWAELGTHARLSIKKCQSLSICDCGGSMGSSCRGHMAELFLAIVACDAKELEPLKLKIGANWGHIQPPTPSSMEVLLNCGIVPFTCSLHL